MMTMMMMTAIKMAFTTTVSIFDFLNYIIHYNKILVCGHFVVKINSPLLIGCIWDQR